MSKQQQYITLGIGEESFAIPIAHVQEILDLRPIARLPHAPHGLIGLIDVREQSMPVMDLRAMLGLPAMAAAPDTRILVLQLELEGRALRLGLVVDRVFEVTALDTASLDARPEIGRRWRSDCIAGIGRRRGGFVILLDVHRLIGEDGALMAEAETLSEPA